MSIRKAPPAAEPPRPGPRAPPTRAGGEGGKQEGAPLAFSRAPGREGEAASAPEVAAAEAGIAEPGGGAALDPGTRAFFEARFGAPLSGVRVHTGPAADRAARGLDALAFTLGRDVAFRSGAYAPGTAEGRRLLGHELAHAVQAGRGPAAGGVSTGGEAAEAEARRAGALAAAGLPARVSAAPAARVQRARMADAPAADRAKLGLPSLRMLIADEVVKEYFQRLKSDDPAAPPRYGSARPAPSGVAVELGGIPDEHRTPMTSIAMYMAGVMTYSSPATGATLPAFGPGVTVTVRLELAGYGLSDADYRFTWTGAADKGTLYIETAPAGAAPLGTVTASEPPAKGGTAPGTPIAAGAAAPSGSTVTFGTRSFTLSTSWGAGRFDDLRAALSLVPGAALDEVAGMKFTLRAGNGPAGEDGHYDDAKHEVVMFESAWEPNRARYGGWRWPVYAIVHEIGHAVDRQPLRKAWSAAKAGTITEAELKKARSPSGGRYEKGEDDVWEKKFPLAGKDGDFRKAAGKDGVKVPKDAATLTGGPTEYAGKDWEDMYAESFALYLTDPDLLKLIRPNLYAYFEKKYPRAP